METDSVSEMWRAMLGNAAFPEYCTVRSNSYVYDVRLEETSILMAQGRFAYMDGECDSLVNALCTAVWDPKELTKNVRLDDGTSDIDSLDSFEYTIERQISQLIRYG